MESLNRDRLEQVNAICSDLEDLIRDTSAKRKKYPQHVQEGVNKILQRRKEVIVRKHFIDYECIIIYVLCLLEVHLFSTNFNFFLVLKRLYLNTNDIVHWLALT